MKDWVVSEVSLMLNPRGSPVGRRFWVAGCRWCFVFPGVLKGVNGPWDLRRAVFWPVTGDWKGWEGGTRFGSQEEEEDALWVALCVPGAVKGAGSKGRWGGTRFGSWEEEDACEPLRAVRPTRDAGPCLFHELVYVFPLLFPLRDGCVDARGCCGPLLNGVNVVGPCLFHEVAYPLPPLGGIDIFSHRSYQSYLFYHYLTTPIELSIIIIYFYIYRTSVPYFFAVLKNQASRTAVLKPYYFVLEIIEIQNS